MSQLRVSILMGGMSGEKEVSLNSGRTICDHLDTSLYAITPIFQSHTGNLYILPPHFLHRGKISDFEYRLDSEAPQITWDDLKEITDFVFIAQHGRFAEDGVLQGMLEVLQIPYFGSKILASALGMNKVMQRQFLIAAGIEVPRGIVVDYDTLSELKLEEVTFPCVVKPSHEGSSLGVTVVHDKKDLLSAIQHAATITPHCKQYVVIEEYISGMEFSCIILTDHRTNSLLPLPPTEIVKHDTTGYFNYEQKYMPGKAVKHTPARCTEAQQKLIQETCVAVVKALGITNLGRIDGFLTPDNRVVIIDPNTFAGMDPASFTFLQAAEINLSHTQLINHLIQTELAHYSMLTTITDASPQEKNNGPRLRVGVLMGGSSHEKEISLASGRNITSKLSPTTYEAVPIFVSTKLELFKMNHRLLVRNTTTEIEAELDQSQKIGWHDLKNHVDFVFIGLHGGVGENGAVQGALEMLKIPYNGSSVLASALCIDKFKTGQFLKNQGLQVPEQVIITEAEWQNKTYLLSLPAYPLIVKPHDDGCSVMVGKVTREQELNDALVAIFESGKSCALVEEYVKGFELTIGVVGNSEIYALPPSLSVASADILSIEEKFLPGAGENLTPAPLAAEIISFAQQTVEAAYKAVGCKGYARIDVIYQPSTMSPTKADRMVILEINTLPGMTPATCIFHQAAEIGMRPMDFISKLITLGLEEHTSVTVQQEIQSVQTYREPFNKDSLKDCIEN